MTETRAGRPVRLIFAGVLLAATAATGWLAVRIAAAEIMQPGDPRAVTWARPTADGVLDSAMVEFVTGRGAVSSATMAKVGQAAQQAPLDGRPYVLFATRELVRNPDAAVLPILEAGRRLDGRQRWTRLLLLDRYIREGRTDDAAREFAVLARLVTSAQTPILAELARLANAPSTRPAVRRALTRDPALERSLLNTLARSNPDPALLYSIASPAARAVAGAPGQWGQTLIATLVERGRYSQARSVWQQVYNVPAPAGGQLLYDAGLRGLPGSPPFNWTLAASAIGAVGLGKGELEISFYGRDTGSLAGQLLALRPGTYRFGYSVAGGPANTAGALSWQVACAGAPGGATLIDVPVPAPTNAPRRIAFNFKVPSGCSAQQLTLRGNAAEFPTEVNVTVTGLSLQAVGVNR